MDGDAIEAVIFSEPLRSLKHSGRSVVRLPKSLFGPGGAIDVLRMKMSQEPSVRGNK